MASIESLTFECPACEPVRQAEGERVWLGAQQVAYSLRFTRGEISWPFDLTDLDAAREFYTRQCAENLGVMLEMDAVRAAGAEALCGVFKYRSPIAGSSGMAYVGILWLPFRDCRFQVNVEAVETGLTGVRETTVMAIEGDNWPKEPQSEPLVVKSWAELHAVAAKTPPRHFPSDHRKYDGSFPQHPLSRVRASLARVIATAQLGPDASGLLPHRVGS